MINVLFVCLGNICRSPMAEAVFQHLVNREGLSGHFHIDSVGTASYHVGDLAHHGTRRVLARHGITCNSLARQITRNDLNQADYIIAMDRKNLTDVHYMAGGSRLDDHLHLLLDFTDNSHIREVPDPYYSGNFEETYRLVKEGCQGLLDHIRDEHGV